MLDFLKSPQAVALGGWVPMVVIVLVVGWLNRRDRRRREVQEQLWDMQQQVWLETLPDSQREAILESRQQQTEIKREARRRLGLPEEEGLR